MELTITIQNSKYTLSNLKMGLWREIQKFKTAKINTRDNLQKQVDQLEGVLDNTAFNLFADRIEISLAEAAINERKQKAEIITKAFNNKFMIDDLLAEIEPEQIDMLFRAIDMIIMDLLLQKGSEMPPSKEETKTNFDAMNEYQQVLHLYGLLHRDYHWSREQIDEEEMEYVFDLFISQAKGNIEKEVPIDMLL